METTNIVDTASGSRIYDKDNKPMIIEETIDLTNMKDVGDNLAASIHGTVIEMRCIQICCIVP